ncbi:transglycosylase domain-containing protein [Butyrivibrio sp. MB2005]|uniref:transglycosylase domain-containing protein n=1 Tax=Butyrivibrio sp. MB2005 TaxID=1280678 RepID=UPI0003F7A74B|nr:transglycosylase domain-containing protein [Butyrivibrio sp. MB2005]
MNFGRKGIRDQQQELLSATTKWGKKISLISLELMLIAFIGLGVIGVAAGIGVFRGIIDTAPEIGNISVTPTGYSTFVYDTEGNQTAKLVSTDSNRIPVSWDMIPENLQHAFVAIEDERFYKHNGIDIQGIIRAAFVGLASRDLSQGASTITQQLLKNNVFTGWTSESSDIAKIKRKIQEQYLAIQLEKTMSKEDILLNYMNTINLGSNTLGVQAASLRYFNKSVANLSLSECAVIAGITQNPSRYNPITHPDNNAQRRDKVLNNMLKQGYITQGEYDEAMADDVYARIQVVDEETSDDSVNSYFVDALTNQLIDDLINAGYNETQAYTLLYSGGLKIYSTQDPAIQAICDSELSNPENYPESTKYLLDYALTVSDSEGNKTNYSSEMMKSYFQQENQGFNLLFSSEEDALAKIEEYKAAVVGPNDKVEGENYNLTPQPQVSLTIEDHATGYVVAMVGGRGAKTASRTLNRATDTVRQPGSTFKVLSAYAPALDSAGFTLATVLNDAPFNYQGGRPVRNWYGEAYRGLTTVRTAIKDSMNIIAVKTITLITPQLAFDYLKNFGFTTIVESEEIGGKIYSDIQATTALGGLTHGVTNLELNAAYAAIANGGVYVKPKLYTKVVDHDGNTILDNTQIDSTRILKDSTAYLLTSAMTDVVTSGTGTAVNFGTTAIAGKTGTTSDENDVWFAGFTNYYTATTWAGYDNNVDMNKEEAKLAKTLWRAVMEKVHADLPAATFEKPDSVITATVCSRSGKAPIAGLCDGVLMSEYFEEGTVPTESCDVHYAGTICQFDNVPATDTCPFKVSGIFELTPAEPAALQAQSGATASETQYTTELDENGNPVTRPIVTCHHTAEFMAQPTITEILAQEQAQLAERGIQVTPQPTDPNAAPAADPNAAPAADPNAAPAADPAAAAQPADPVQQNAEAAMAEGAANAEQQIGEARDELGLEEEEEDDE